MEDAVSIANAIHEAVHAHPSRKPSDGELRAVMQHYRDSRIRRVQRLVTMGGDWTRLQAYDGWAQYLIYRWIGPLVGHERVAESVSRLSLGAPKLSYVPFDEQRGIWAWRDSLSDAEKLALKRPRRNVLRIAWDTWHGNQVVAAMIALWLVAWALGGKDGGMIGLGVFARIFSSIINFSSDSSQMSAKLAS